MAVDLLPDEVIVEILSILPAKSLLRFRLVCKSWLNLISSTKFKEMHLHNFNQLNPRYFICRLAYSAIKKWFCVHFDDEAFTLDRNLQFPFLVWYRIIGCCNGVVCLDGWPTNPNSVILLNPSIRRKLTLPLPMFKIIQFEDSLVALGFGYHKISDDYKVVRLFYPDVRLTRPPRAEVYTLKTGIWREVMFPDDLCCFYIQMNWSQVFFDGCVHWIACDPTPGVSHYSIITFDVTTELFGEIMLPDVLVKVQLGIMLISVIGESLAVTYYNSLINRARGTSSTYKIWVMKDYKNPTSWTLMYNMHYSEVDMGIPWQMRNKGDMILESRDGNIIVYNYYGGYVCRICPEYESTKNCLTYVDKYQESLALLDVGHSVSNEETDECSDDD